MRCRFVIRELELRIWNDRPGGFLHAECARREFDFASFELPFAIRAYAAPSFGNRERTRQRIVRLRAAKSSQDRMPSDWLMPSGKDVKEFTSAG
jgi:hypothetical protein